MNYFDRHLESELRLLLEQIVKAPAPPRKAGHGRSILEESKALEPTFATPARVPVEAFA